MMEMMKIPSRPLAFLSHKEYEWKKKRQKNKKNCINYHQCQQIPIYNAHTSYALRLFVYWFDSAAMMMTHISLVKKFQHEYKYISFVFLSNLCWVFFLVGLRFIWNMVLWYLFDWYVNILISFLFFIHFSVLLILTGNIDTPISINL